MLSRRRPLFLISLTMSVTSCESAPELPPSSADDSPAPPTTRSSAQKSRRLPEKEPTELINFD
eukprot:959919-Pyramimonas_sp.AAC.1